MDAAWKVKGIWDPYSDSAIYEDTTQGQASGFKNRLRFMWDSNGLNTTWIKILQIKL